MILFLTVRPNARCITRLGRFSVSFEPEVALEYFGLTLIVDLILGFGAGYAVRHVISLRRRARQRSADVTFFG